MHLLFECYQLKLDAKIDGEYFISILKGEESLEIEVSHGFKFRLNKKKQKVLK